MASLMEMLRKKQMEEYLAKKREADLLQTREELVELSGERKQGLVSPLQAQAPARQPEFREPVVFPKSLDLTKLSPTGAASISSLQESPTGLPAESGSPFSIGNVLKMLAGGFAGGLGKIFGVDKAIAEAIGVDKDTIKSIGEKSSTAREQASQLAQPQDFDFTGYLNRLRSMRKSLGL